MKKNFIYPFAFLFLTLLDLNVSAQEEKTDSSYSTIYLVRKYKSLASGLLNYITFPHQERFALSPGSVVQYKVYSEGEVLISAKYIGALGITLYCNLNVKHGKEYYVYLNYMKISEVIKDTVKKILENPVSFTTHEENIDALINKIAKEATKKTEKNQATSFLINSSGYLITNFHCIENAKEITIKGIDGDFTTKYAAVVVATDPTNDLALLKLSNKNLKFNNVPFGLRTSGVAQAEKIYALGFPKALAMGEEIKITEGIISSKSGVQGDVSKFQISASVNPGNSGGPLIDEDGNIIGVVYAKSTIADAAGYAIKAGYLEMFLKNVDGFEYPVFINSMKGKILTEKIKDLKNYIFIIETN